MSYTVDESRPSRDNGVFFSREQFEYLNRTFPEFVGKADTTLQEYQFQSGLRRVVAVVGSRVR